MSLEFQALADVLLIWFVLSAIACIGWVTLGLIYDSRKRRRGQR